MPGLNETKKRLEASNIRPSKKLGQSFLIDDNIRKKIIQAIILCKEDTVVEIGPGLGALTEDLCKAAGNVIAIEKDKRLYNFLKENLCFDNLALKNIDALKYDFKLTHSKVKVIGNLPYYISSQILNLLIENREFVDSAYITVQREFANRIIATPCTKDYGSLSCYVQFYAEPRILFTIKKNAFYPAPKVDSCFLKIDIRKQGLFLTDREKLFKIIRTAFGKRRKTILNSLCSDKGLGPKEKVLEKLEEAGILPDRRPETISLPEFVKLAKIFTLQ
jgi:16S rRNA (adenine1518-N6/adenine1519-N6)-dimethyltransferase